MITEKKLIESGYKRCDNQWVGCSCTYFYQKKINVDFYINFRHFDFSNIDVPYDYIFDSVVQFEMLNGDTVDIDYYCGYDGIDIEDVENFYKKFYEDYCSE